MIAIISDIHGNLPALQAVLEEIDRMGCESVISLGDVVGYYAQPGECINVLKDRGIVNILGNHDEYIVNGATCTRSKLISDIIEYQRTIISNDQKTWLSHSERFIAKDRKYFLHGGWKDLVDQYMYTVSENDFPEEADMLFAGHTHVQIFLDIKGKKFCNPGSVGQPRDGNPRAAFATLSGNHVDLHRVEYDIDRTAAAMREAGFAPKCYENLYHGTQIGGRVDTIIAQF